MNNYRLAEEATLKAKLIILDDPSLRRMRQLSVSHVLSQLSHGALVLESRTMNTLEELHDSGH